MQPGREWSRLETERTGKRIAALRDDPRRHGGRRLSARALAERTEALGYPVSRATLAKLESGQRDDLTVSELRVLARALDVPPALLLCPLGSEEDVVPLPGEDGLDPYTAYNVFVGDEVHAGGVVRGPDPTVEAYRRHQQFQANWRRRSGRDPKLAAASLDALVAVRAEMSAYGWSLPVLAPDVASAVLEAQSAGRLDGEEDL